MDRRPWECPRCRHINSPYVDQCPCDPDGEVPAIVLAPPSTQPPALMTTTNHPWQAWVTYSGGGGATTTSTMTIVPSLSSINDARRQLGKRPWGDSDAAA